MQPLAFAKTDHRLGLYPVVDLQLRIKDPQATDLEQQIQQAIELGRRYQARLFINDYWQLAIKHGAYGVHLGQEDIQTADLDALRQAGLRLGISTHDAAELAEALALKPSYVALGHIFPTQTKEMPSQPQGLINLAAAVKQAGSTPTVAIGGISEERVADILATGVGSVALVSAITKAADPEQATKRLLQQVEGARSEEPCDA